MIHKLKLIPILLIILLFLELPINEISRAESATIRISNRSFVLAVNHYKTLSIIGTKRKITWSSSNRTVVTVSTNGRVMAKTPGKSIIYAKVSGKKLSCTVTVIKLQAKTAVLAVGSSKTLKVYGTSSKITWTTSNKTVATVSPTGKVTAKKTGTATIYASVLGKKLPCIITTIKLNTSVVALTVGATKTLKVYGTSKTVRWSSSNNEVVKVATTGVITAKAAGTASVTATVLGIKITSKITVKNPVILSKPVILPKPVNLPIPAVKIVGYYAAWSRYSGYSPNKIDATKLTSINYAFANIGNDLKISLGYPDIDPANISDLNQLKKINPNLKTMISVGGWTWSGRFSDVASTEKSRTIFAVSCVDFIVKYGFDGVDIDWEYPVNGGLSTNVKRPEDKYNYTLLLKTIREKLDERGVIEGKKYLLTFAGAAGSWYIKNTELDKISQYVDYANIMTYDLHGTWEQYTNFNAPLYSDDLLLQDNISIDTCIKNWINAGFPKNKLVMGVPFYGFIFKGVADINHGLLQSYSGGTSISYANIAANYLKAPEYNQYYNSIARVPWLFNGSTFITYENEQSISEKAKYIKETGLCGVMIWELSQDTNKVLLNSLHQSLIQ